jgi:hypothetical protein
MKKIKKLRFETKIDLDDQGQPKKTIYIDGELFDWDVDKESLEQARALGPAAFAMIQQDIQRHFAESVSEFISRKVTEQDICKAIVTGWI